MEPLVQGLWNSFEKNHAYMFAMVEDLSDAQMIWQPENNLPKAMNHAAWVLCHLKTYRPIIAGLITDGPIDDPIDHEYGMKSVPLLDRNSYPSKKDLLEELEMSKRAIELAFRSVAGERWGAPLPIERWQNRWGCIGVGVSYLTLGHESLHLGQLSAWRRALGLPSVKV